MQAILYRGIALFCCCLAIHILVWRIWKVRHEGLWLTLIFLVAPAISLPIFLGFSFGWTVPTIDWQPIALTYLLHCAISISYMLLYTGITGFSPSIAILQRVASSMPVGLERNELAPDWFTDEMLTGVRNENLKNLGLISESVDGLQLQPGGRFVAFCFLVFRRLLGLSDVADG
jgi:hypothetical protein